VRYRRFERTRDFRTDYRWVGEHPEEWWRGHPAAGIVVNQRGVLRVGDKWLLTGVPAGREDSIGTPITSDFVFVPMPDGEASESELAGMLNQHFPGWENSSDTMTTNEFTVHSPLLTPEVKAHLSPSVEELPSGVSKPRSYLAQHDGGVRGGGVAKGAGGGGGCLVAMIGLVAIPALCHSARSRRI